LITRDEVEAAQQAWGDGVIAIGKAYADGGDYRALALETIDRLYGYDLGPVLFKPTWAMQTQFRPTREDALSYFVKGHIDEDRGFAIAGWAKVRFDNHNMILGEETALAMGNYVFTDADGTELKAEYSFGYMRDANRALRIILQHSSAPFAG